MEIINKPIDQLIPYARNPRKNDDAVDSVAASIKEFGFKQPIVIDADNVVVAGHTRLKAAHKLGLKKVPCVVASDLTPAQVKAYRLLDNKVAEKADWEPELLEIELEELDLDLSAFDVDWTVFERVPDAALAYADADMTDDEVPEAPREPVTKLGDLWLMGDHRVLCGDSTKMEDVARLMDDAAPRAVVTSPPYGDLRDYDGTKTDGLLENMFKATISLPLKHTDILINLGPIYRAGVVEYWRPLLDYATSAGWPLYGMYVWDKGAGFPGNHHARLWPSHEYVFHWHIGPQAINKWIPTRKWSGTGKKAFRKADGSLKLASSPTLCGQATKGPDSVIRIDREYARGIHTENHPAVFPVEFPAFLMRTWSNQADVIYDPFLGSGTTMIAAHRLGRKCYGLEIAPHYVDVICQRFFNETGIIPHREDSTPFPVDREGRKEKSVNGSKTQE